jgi:hypothetical protein
MVESETKKVQRVYHILMATLVVLLCSQVVAFLLSSIEYLVGIVIAFVIAGIRYGYLHKRGAGSVEKALTLFIVIMAVFGPIIFLLIKWLIVGEPMLGVEGLLALLFILPIALLLYCIYTLKGLLSVAGS